MGKKNERNDGWVQDKFQMPPVQLKDTKNPPEAEPTTHKIVLDKGYQEMAHEYGVDAATVRHAIDVYGPRYIDFLDLLRENDPDIAHALMNLNELPPDA